MSRVIWFEEHNRWHRFLLWLLDRPHCGMPNRRGEYAPGEAPRRTEPERAEQ